MGIKRRERATEFILAHSTVDPVTGCSNWNKARAKSGYGVMTFKGRVQTCHRIIWEEANGPTRLQVLHTCDNRQCAELGHLYAGTNEQNVVDKCTRDRSGKKLTIAKVKEAKAMLRAGHTQRHVASVMQVSACTINEIVVGRTWAHVTTEGQPMASAAV